MRQMQNKIYGLLGLAARGRNVVSGEFATENVERAIEDAKENAVKNGSAVLVIVAKDASDNTRELFHDKCSFYEVPVFDYGMKAELGHCIGKDERAALAVVDEGLAEKMIQYLNASEN